MAEMRLIRGVSATPIKVPLTVTFAAQLFRRYVAPTRLLFRREEFRAPRASQLPGLDAVFQEPEAG
jgi:hypothetical protein